MHLRKTPLRYFKGDPWTIVEEGMVVFDLKDGVFSARTTDDGRTWNREPVATTYDAATLYLAHDGLTFIAIHGLSDLTVLRYQQP
jgi:hypothetical protein